MSKLKVEVTGAVVDGFPIGSTIEIDARSAKALEAKGYVRILPKEQPKEQPKTPQVKKDAAPKKPAKAPVKKSAKSKDK